MWLTEPGQFGVRSHQTAKSHLIPPSALSTITRWTHRRFSNLLISKNISVIQRKAIIKLSYEEGENVLQSHLLFQNTVVKIFKTVITLINFYACATLSLDITYKLKMKLFEEKCWYLRQVKQQEYDEESCIIRGFITCICHLLQWWHLRQKKWYTVQIM